MRENNEKEEVTTMQKEEE